MLTAAAAVAAAIAAGAGAGGSGASPAPKIACPPEVPGCVVAAGRIVALERIDPDGDGDAHFVLLTADGVTAPGITVVDVAPELRPHPLPGPGETLSAAGPVHTGSYGQRQIEAVEIAVAEDYSRSSPSSRSTP